MSVVRPHPYDEDYEAAVSPWLTFVEVALTRATTKQIEPELLSAMTERCKEK